MIEVTPSLKTRIEMIGMIGPRLVDPGAKLTVFMSMFRYSEDKHAVEEILKARSNALQAEQFTKKQRGSFSTAGRGLGGRGERPSTMLLAGGGRGGRGSRPMSTIVPSVAAATPSPMISPRTLARARSKSLQQNPEICPEEQAQAQRQPSREGSPRTPGFNGLPLSPSTTDGTTDSRVVPGLLSRSASERPLPALPSPGPTPVRIPSKSKLSTTPSSAFAGSSSNGPEIAHAGENAGTTRSSVSFLFSNVDAEPRSTSPITDCEVFTPFRNSAKLAPVSSADSTLLQVSASDSQNQVLSVKAPVHAISESKPQEALDGAPIVNSSFIPLADSIPMSTVVFTNPQETILVSTAALINPVSSVSGPSGAQAASDGAPTVAGGDDAQPSNGSIISATVTPTSSSVSPIPIVITARAPQRGHPPPASSRRAKEKEKESTGHHSTAGNTSISPISVTPDMSPSTSSANLSSLGAGGGGGASGAQHSGSHGHGVHAASGSTNNSGGIASATLSNFHQPYIPANSLAGPMVADCPTLVRVNTMRSMFQGGAKPASGTTPPIPKPLDYVPTSGRKISDLMNAFAAKPPTPTAHQDTRNGTANGGAPAPIAIPGSSVSLAHVRAKFNNNSTGNSSSPLQNDGDANNLHAPPKRHASFGFEVASCPTSPSLGRVSGRELEADAGPVAHDDGTGSSSTTKKMVRRHSEYNNARALFVPTSAGAASFLSTTALSGFSPRSSNSNGSSNCSTPNSGSVNSSSIIADLAARCATALNMTRSEFLALEPQGPVDVGSDVGEFAGKEEVNGAISSSEPVLRQFTYQEVVRRNFVKDEVQMLELNTTCLEMHVQDSDFMQVFQKTKVLRFILLYCIILYGVRESNSKIVLKTGGI
jgi:hypothetical protein